MVMRLDIDLAAFAAFNHRAMGVVVVDIHQQLCFAATTAIGLVAAALAQWLARFMVFDVGTAHLVSVDDDHVELRHRRLLCLALREPLVQPITRVNAMG